jgi:hypothetical protein
MTFKYTSAINGHNVRDSFNELVESKFMTMIEIY